MRRVLMEPTPVVGVRFADGRIYLAMEDGLTPHGGGERDGYELAVSCAGRLSTCAGKKRVDAVPDRLVRIRTGGR